VATTSVYFSSSVPVPVHLFSGESSSASRLLSDFVRLGVLLEHVGVLAADLLDLLACVDGVLAADFIVLLAVGVATVLATLLDLGVLLDFGVTTERDGDLAVRSGVRVSLAASP
jgi:hypothetical protein